jgi:predicted ArsR family transcriptional regulator
MTVANIRHHLRRLEDDQLIQVVEKRPVSGRGRPNLIYGLTHRAKNDDLRRLTTALWLELLEDLTEPEAKIYLEKLARRILGTDSDLGGSLTQRLYSAVRQLRGLEYDARWEAHAESPIVILEHCPYSGIQPQVPGLCSLDKEILFILLGQPVEQTTVRHSDRGGPTQCVFRVLGE